MRVLLCAFFIAAIFPMTTAAQSYPSKPVRLIVPFPPGGSNDVVGRMIAVQLSARLDKAVIVENQGGAGGLIGTEMAARSTRFSHSAWLTCARTGLPLISEWTAMAKSIIPP